MPTKFIGITIVLYLIRVVILIIRLICYLNLIPSTKFLLSVRLFCLYLFYLFNFWSDLFCAVLLFVSASSNQRFHT